MSLHVSSILGRTKKWLLGRPSTRGQQERGGSGLFNQAQNFTINDGQFTNVMNGATYVNNVILNGAAVFNLLEPYTCLDATKDSSARDPPPKCHPGTRLKIRDRLTQWLCDGNDEWKMLWVRGFAGTGKSAVAQSFADFCEEKAKHGGSYFFSRTAGRNKLESVVPTLVYQLAGAVPEYRYLIEHQLAGNPILLRNSPPVQFRKLIIEPFAILQHQSPFEPIVIILDGLDECEKEDAQLKILEMITNGLRTNPDLPLRWLIFSRPEAHLKDAFSRLTSCGREELIIDAECREDVERYARECITQIKDRFRKFVPPDWPPETQWSELVDTVSGLFVLASTCLKFIGDPEEADPQSQLDALLMFLRRSQGVLSRNPLAALDLLYSRILENIPPTAFKTTRRILAYLCYKRQIDEYGDLSSAQALGNFLRLDQRAFFKAVQGFHSVMSIPELEDASQLQLQFHHASFQDFLLDPNRCGKFFIDERMALMEIIQSGLKWFEVRVMDFHVHNALVADKQNNINDLTWAPVNNQMLLSGALMRFIEHNLFYLFFEKLSDEELLSQVSNIDFKCWPADNVLYLAARLSRLDLSNSVIRTEPSGSEDHQLLQRFNIVIDNGPAKPAIFPLRDRLPGSQWIREYFFIGQSVRSVLVWRTKSPASWDQITYSLCDDKKHSDAQVSQYLRCLQTIGWDEERAKREMGRASGKWEIEKLG